MQHDAEPWLTQIEAAAIGRQRKAGEVMQQRCPEPGPATLGTTARAHLLLRVWCKACGHSVDLDPDAQAVRYGADLPVPEWAARLACSRCGSRTINFVIAPRHTGPYP